MSAKGWRAGFQCFGLLLITFSFLMPRSASASPGDLKNFTSQIISQERAKLYLAAAKGPLGKMAGQIYEFAADSELCRVHSGAKACGLPSDPLESTDLKQIYDYYIQHPINAAMNKKQIQARKSHWAW